MDPRAVEVALPLPLQSTFTYRVPGGASLPGRGVRVLVPFGPRRVIGLVTGPAITVPETMIRSAWRGEGLKTSAPNRARSYRAMLVAIISMAQHARPNVIGHTEFFRHQFAIPWTVARTKPPF